MAKKRTAVVLFSGGLDSTTCLAIAKADGFDCYALSFVYGQKHSVEIAASKKLAEKMGVIKHIVLTLPLDEIGGSSLTDKNASVADYQESPVIPNTYVPARNTIFLSCALGVAETVKAQDIFIGANVLDYSGYPDCRPEYLDAFEKLAALATKMGSEGDQFKIHAPLIKLNKADIIREGMRLGINYADTISCYRANEQGEACGNCDSCVYRKRGFEEAEVADPTLYVS